jgi:hypothetical protein
MLLYTPAPRRAMLAMLLAVATELDSGRQRQIDHGIAHLRLQWWREETGRLASGTQSHPWLRARDIEPQAAAAGLASLIEAAELDLAAAPAGGIGPQLAAGLFVQAARLLLPARGPSPGAAGESEAPQCTLLPTLGELGRCVAGLERLAAPAEPLAWLKARQRAAPLIEPALQPSLAPLLVWIATAAGQAQRRARRAAHGSATIAASPLDGFADNFTAWRCARAAARGRFRIFPDEPSG